MAIWSAMAEREQQEGLMLHDFYQKRGWPCAHACPVCPQSYRLHPPERTRPKRKRLIRLNPFKGK